MCMCCWKEVYSTVLKKCSHSGAGVQVFGCLHVYVHTYLRLRAT